jgi:hypothetical protein
MKSTLPNRWKAYLKVETLHLPDMDKEYLRNQICHSAESSFKGSTAYQIMRLALCRLARTKHLRYKALDGAIKILATSLV